MENRLQEEQKLRLYMAYEDHLYAEQLSKLLSSLDNLYNQLYIAQAPELSLPLPLETRMRVDETRTGHSIEMVLSEGIRQVLDTVGPIIQVLGPTGVVAAMVSLIFGYAKSFAEFRKTWYGVTQAKYVTDKARYEADKAKYEADKAMYEAERLKRELESEKVEQQLNQSHYDLSAVPSERKQKSSEALTDFFNLVEYAPNIVRVQVNEVVILDKQPERQNPKNQQA
jgi:hypothetical protein